MVRTCIQDAASICLSLTTPTHYGAPKHSTTASTIQDESPFDTTPESNFLYEKTRKNLFEENLTVATLYCWRSCLQIVIIYCYNSEKGRLQDVKTWSVGWG